MSSPFRFAPILLLRQRQRDEAAAELEEVHRAIEILDSQIVDVQQELSELDSSRRECLRGEIAVHRIMDIQRHQLILLGNVQFLASQRGKLVQEKTRREHRLLKCQQALKSMEKLAEHQRHAFAQEEAKRLQSRLDEWANTRDILGTLNPSSRLSNFEES